MRASETNPTTNVASWQVSTAGAAIATHIDRLIWQKPTNCGAQQTFSGVWSKPESTEGILQQWSDEGLGVRERAGGGLMSVRWTMRSVAATPEGF